MKSTDQILKIAERIIEKLVKQQVNLYEMQFGFMSGRGTTNAIFILTQIKETHLAKKKILYFPYVDLEKASDRVPRHV